MQWNEFAKPQYPIWVNIIVRLLFTSVTLIRSAALPASPSAIHPVPDDERPPERATSLKMSSNEERVLIHELLTGISFPPGPGNF